jgi:hypothetical protein
MPGGLPLGVINNLQGLQASRGAKTTPAFPPTVLDPWASPDHWDSIAINGAPWGKGTQVGGGIVVRRHKRFYAIDQKDAKGQDGSTQTYSGAHPKSFELVFRIWTSAQWQYFNVSILPFFFYSGTQNKVQAVTVDYPGLALLNIARVLVDDIGGLDVDDKDKMGTMVVTVREYLPAALGNASVTPVGPPPPPSFVGYTPSPKIAQLTQVAQQLSNQANSEPATLP